MILEKLKTLDIENIGDTEEGIEAGIAEDSMPFVFEFVSTQLYSNPIGSLIREITSNCHDSHVEAGVTDPVIVKMFSKPDEGWFIEFIDKGVGISPERMLNIYMNYFSSTKRGDNKQIGGFGLGSKTPLAYQDYFYIDTVFDGMKYEYLYHKGETKPTLESLKGYDYVNDERYPIGEPTEEHNGTIIRIQIKDTFKDGNIINYTSDISKFKDELRKQLTYFDDVYFSGCSINNDYDIYEGKYFKFRSDIDQYNNNIHVSLGNVKYTIDPKFVKIPTEMLSIPIAVKFEVGELKVTPSRESLRYTEEDVKKIQERIGLLRQELEEKFDLQNPIIDNINHFLRNKTQTIKIAFDESKGHQLHLWSGSAFSKSVKYAPLADLPIKYPENLFFMWKIVGMLSYGAIRNTKAKNVIQFSEEDFIRGNFMVVEDISHLSQYTNQYINERYPYSATIYLVSRDKKADKFSFELKGDIFRMLGLRTGRFTEGKGSDNKARIAYQYIKEIDRQVKLKSMGTYESYKPSKEWVSEYKRREYERTASYQRMINEQIFVRDIGAGFGKDIKKLKLLKSKEFIIFGYREDKEELIKLSWSIRYYYDTNRAEQKRARRNGKVGNPMIIQVAQSALKGIQHQNPNIIYWSDFYNHKFMINLKARFTRTIAIDGVYDAIKARFLKGYKEDHDRLKDKWYGKLNFRRLNEWMSKERMDKIPKIPRLMDDVEAFKEKYNIKIPILHQYPGIENSDDWLLILRLVKESGIRLLNQYYLKTSKRLAYERKRRTIRITRNIGQFNKSQIKTTQDGQEATEEGCYETAIQHLPEESREELHRED
jgi:hypothetical protein